MSTAASANDTRRASAPASSVPIVEARGITKRFGPTTALSNAEIVVNTGESHGLVGRNGAGKSTLVAILTGIVAPDSGSIRFDGAPAPALSDRDGWRRHVACVYQHSTIIPDLSVAENLFINRQPRDRGFINWTRLRSEARELLARWHVDVSEELRAGDLTVEQRQLVEIARALSYGARFIILDEPTAQLDGNEIKRLFERVRELQTQGVTFLFISHHLQEVYEICQAVTVYRDARHIITAPVADLPRAKLIEAMTGDQDRLDLGENAGKPLPSQAKVALSIERLSGDQFSDVSFSVREGEIVGIAGATSSGRTEIAETIVGLRAPRAGAIDVEGRPLPTGNVAATLSRGVGFVPKSRHVGGLVLLQSVGENATLTAHRRLGGLGFISPRRKEALAERMIDTLGVVTEGPEQPVSSLSGGNQQKVVMGRALATDPSVLVLIDPTAGVDVKSKVALLGTVERLRDEGKGIVLSSSEIEDLRICDRVIVMLHGKVVAEHKAGWSDTALIAAIEGMSND